MYYTQPAITLNVKLRLQMVPTIMKLTYTHNWRY